ncbi:MAG TPA: M4 family metallopeptidase [Ruminococcus sp.]|nr:M4 family metallopeptidase [Ruminococcus sp.]
MDNNSTNPIQGDPQEQSPVTASAQPVQPAAKPDPSPAGNVPVSGGAASGQNSPKKKSKLPLIIIILIAVIGLCIGGYFLYQHLSDDDSGSKKSKKTSKADSGNVVDSDKIDLTDYDFVSEEPTEESVVYDGPEESYMTQLSISRDENGDFEMLSGTFDDIITSSDDALQFIAAHSDSIGVKDTYNELSLLEENTSENITYYKFKQLLNGVTVYGNELIVAVDAEGKVDSVSGSYTDVDISTTPSESQNDAEHAAMLYAGKEPQILSCELVVLPRTESGTPKLAYDIEVTGESKSGEVFVDAGNGEIIAENKLYYGASEILDVDANGSKYRVELEQAAIGGYNLYDPTRDITISDAGMTSLATAAAFDGFFGGFNPLSAVKTSENSDGSVKLLLYPKLDLLGLLELPTPGSEFDKANLLNPKMTEYAVGSLSSIEKAYDYYDIMCGWKSIDGNGMPLKIIVGAQGSLAELSGKPVVETGNKFKDIVTILTVLLPRLKDEENACYVKDSNIIVVGAINEKPLVGPGILGHEYTHGVIDNIAHLKADVQPATVNEGYADVMGSVISGSWEFMKNEVPKSWDRYDSAVRSAIDPNAYSSPAIKDTSDEFYKEYPTDEHQNASIISHTAYLMTTKGLTDNEVAGVYFNSMFRLASYTTMERAALAIIRSGSGLCYTSDKQKAIAEALAETKMLETEGKITINVHCGNRYIPDAEVTINGKKVGTTDDKGVLVLDYDPDWVFYADVNASAAGFDGLTQTVSLLGDEETLDFDLSVNADFGKTHGSDDEKKGESTGEMVTVTILSMEADGTSSHAKEQAQEYYVQKGSRIDLHKLVDAMNEEMKKIDDPSMEQFMQIDITTDGTKIYFDTGIMPVELSYHIYGSDEVFDFSKPIYEDVVIEPVVGLGGYGSFGGQDLNDLAEELDRRFNGGGSY